MDAKGRATGGTNPTTLAGFGIIDAAPLVHTHALDALSNVTILGKATGDLLQWNGSDWVNRTLAGAGVQPAGSYLTGNQAVTITGDASGSGATAITLAWRPPA